MKRRLGPLLALVVAGALCVIVPAEPATAAGGVVVKQRLTVAIKKRPGARETRGGYDRDEFRHWIDAEGTAVTPATKCSPPSRWSG